MTDERIKQFELATEIIGALRTECHLNQEEIINIVDTVNIFEWVNAGFESLYCNGIYYILAELQNYLKTQYNITIKFKQPFN